MVHDLPGSPPVHRKTSQIQSLGNLEKQLAIEQRVKEGAESMIRIYSKPKSKRERNLLSDAQQMLDDSKTKVEVLKMRILKLRSESAQSSARDMDDRKKSLHSDPQSRIAMLRYRVDVETRLLQGARSIMRAQSDKKSDKKSYQSVSAVWPRGVAGREKAFWSLLASPPVPLSLS